MSTKSAALAVAIAVTLIAGCGNGADDDTVLDVFAAASLTDAFTEIAESYETENPGTEVRLTFGGSSSLREQLLDGAGADVFASANRTVTDSLVDAGMTAGDPVDFATNQLVVAAPAGNPGGVGTIDDLARSDLFVGLCTSGVPCGDLADRVLAAAGIDASVDTREPDVRALAARLVDRELDAALIYASDAQAFADDLVVFPTGHPVATHYPIVAVEGASAAAERFIDHVVGPGSAVLAKWGFGQP